MPNLRDKDGVLTTSDKQSTSRTRGAKTKDQPFKLLSDMDTTCKVCSEIVQGKSIECDRCKSWIHKPCTGLDEDTYKYLEVKKDTPLMYLCPSCKSEVDTGASLNDIEVKLNARIDDLTRMVSLVINQNQQILERSEKKEVKESQVVWPTVETKIQDSMAEIIQDQRDKEEKQNNLILFGLPESAQMEDGRDNKVEDHKKVADAFLHVDKDLQPSMVDQNQIEVTRIGRKKNENDGKPRPVKVKFSRSGTRVSLLRNARNLKDYKIPKLGISPDKTQKELEEDRKLRTELKIKREADTKTDYVIYQKKVMMKSEADKIKEERKSKFFVSHPTIMSDGASETVKQD